jgi:hypothetical protein
VLETLLTVSSNNSIDCKRNGLSRVAAPRGHRIRRWISAPALCHTERVTKQLYMCLMISSPNWEHLTLVAPGIMRWKS